MTNRGSGCLFKLVSAESGRLPTQTPALSRTTPVPVPAFRSTLLTSGYLNHCRETWPRSSYPIHPIVLFHLLKTHMDGYQLPLLTAAVGCLGFYIWRYRSRAISLKDIRGPDGAPGWFFHTFLIRSLTHEAIFSLSRQLKEVNANSRLES